MAIKNDTDAYKKALLEKAIICSKMKRYNEAIAMFDELTQKEKKDEDLLLNAYHEMGTALSFVKKHEEAIEEFKKAIKLNANIAIVYENCGVALSNLKRLKI